MPSRKYKTWQLLGILLLSILIPMATVIAVTSQSVETTTAKTNSHRLQHRVKDYFANIRLLPPATVTEIDGNRVYYTFVDDGINLGSLELEPGYSVVPNTFSTDKHDGCYAIYYCDQHKVVLDIQEVDSKLCHLNKN